MKATAINVLVLVWIAQIQLVSAQDSTDQIGPSLTSQIETNAAPATGDIYVDQVLETDAVDGDVDIDIESDMVPEGRRRVTVEYRMFGADNTFLGRGAEHGLVFRGERETLNKGDFVLDLAASTSSGDRFLGIRPDNGFNFTLAQYDLPLGDGWRANNIAGVTRTQVDADIALGYRVSLPSTIIRGIRSTVESDTGALRFSFGELGRLLGRSTLTFDETSGSLAGIGYSQQFGGGLGVAAQFYHLEGDPLVEDHQSLVALVQKETNGGAGLWQAKVLGDSKGNVGAWADVVARYTAWTHRFGGYYLDPGLLWTDASISNDQRGLYLRSDRFSLRNTLTLGLDVWETNLDNDFSRPGVREAIGFASTTQRLSEQSTLGGSVRFSNRERRAGSVNRTGSGVDLSAFTTATLGPTTHRLQFRYANIPGLNDTRDEARAVDWDGRWILSRNAELRSFAQWGRGEDNRGSAEDRSIGLGFRQKLGNGFGWTGDVSHTQQYRDRVRASSGSRINLKAYWQMDRNWRFDLQVDWGHNDLWERPNVEDFNETNVYLTLRYDQSKGQPFRKLGGGSGASEVSGRVFFDDNNDGIRQPTERVARRIAVTLNNRFTEVTDADGRFSFFPVASGSHAIELGLEDVPLPWILSDDSPRSVSVGARGSVVVDFPLVRSDQ